MIGRVFFCIAAGLSVFGAGDHVVHTSAGNRTIIRLGDTRQTIHSFGASDCWTAKFVGEWADEEKKNRIADLLFSMDTLADGSPKGIGLSLWRFNIGAGSFEQGAASGIRTDWRREECFLSADGTWDWEKQQGQQWFLDAARRRGVRYTLGFSISPPVHMTRNGKAFSRGGNSLNIQPEKLDDFAVFLTKVSAHFGFDYLSPVNEPQWEWTAKKSGASQEGSPAQNAEISRLVRLLSKELASSDAGTQVVVGEAGEWDYLYEKNKDGRGNQIEAFFSPESPHYIGGLPNVLNVISGHSYWTTCPDARLFNVRQQVAGKVASLEAPPEIWQTEFGILGDICGRYSGPPRNTGIDYGLYVARVIHHDLTVAEVSSWQWWLGINPYDYSDGLVYINDPEGNIRPGNAKHDGIVLESKQLWVLGNFSRFIRPGMQRVEAGFAARPAFAGQPASAGERTGSAGAPAASAGQPTSSAEVPRGLLVSAYRDPETDKLVVVIINEATQEQQLTLPETLAGRPVEAYTTDARRNLERSDIKGDHISVPPRSVTTLVAQHTQHTRAAADPATYLDTIKAELRKQWPRNRTINLVFHGHSVPSGYFRTPEVHTFESYPYLVLKQLKSLYPNAVINVILTSIGGENSVQGAARFRDEVLVHRPDVLFIDYALNDRRPGLEKARAAWKEMIEAALEKNVKVILLTPSPDLRVDMTQPGNELEAFTQMIRDLAGHYHVGLADAYAQFSKRAVAGEDLKEFMSQVNHPNLKGHGVIAKEVFKFFE